ncbi:MAG: ATP-dependent RecD-like DNA helicase [Oscillospiraceae bacterium]|jgi:exodeoxyribonuclease V alpha subunit|nr:ATP-dependent RecD-like DNA helicase [Oscillospiraceae bacterium]
MKETQKNFSGTVSSVIFSNADNGYAVVRFVCDKNQSVGTADREIVLVGALPGISPGELLDVTAHSVVHRSFGEQFQVDAFTRKMPTTEAGIAAYLGSGLIKGLGPALAKKIVQQFGELTLRIIEDTPERLSEIRGITPKRAQEIGGSFAQMVGIRNLLEFMNGFSAPVAVTSRLYRAYGSRAEGQVRDNPYIITEAEFGGVFDIADKIAQSLGFSGDCRERCEAAVKLTLRRYSGLGHVYCPETELCREVEQFLWSRGAAGDIAETVSEMVSVGRLNSREVSGENAVYLPELFACEQQTCDRLLALCEDDDPIPEAAALEALRISGQQENIEYESKQANAVMLAAQKKVLAITGGPGTGKTTTLKAILALFDAAGLRTLLCAPTGRAAKRMSEVTGDPYASTIHRAIGARASAGDDTLVFENNANNPIKADCVVIDEASMIDIELVAALLGAIPDGARVIFIGDRDQLPSVGPGNVFADIIDSGVIPVVCLSRIFRQGEGSGIVSAAHEVNSGIFPEIRGSGAKDIFFLPRSGANNIAETIVGLVSDRLPNKQGISPDNIQVLTPTRKGAAGTAELNRRLQEALNPSRRGQPEYARGDTVYRIGDRIMQTKNNYDITWETPDGEFGAGVFNGDFGAVTEIDGNFETLTVNFDDRTVTYMYTELPTTELAYAVTVHKSQGSEYKCVVLALPQVYSMLATRPILYTAITRAAQMLVIVGEEGVFRQMVSAADERRRYCGLKDALLGADLG